MPRLIQRMGDFNSKGGSITFPNNTNVFANLRLVAAGPALVAPHPPCPTKKKHCVAVTIPKSNVFINGLPVVAEGDSDSCGDVRVLGSSDVFIGP